MVCVAPLGTVMSTVPGGADLNVGRGVKTGSASGLFWLPLIVPELLRVLKKALPSATAPFESLRLSATTA